MREDDPAARRRRIAETRQFPHQKGVRQAMEAVALNTLRRVPARNRQLGGDARHASMKRRVEANDLRQSAVAALQCLDELDLTRHVFGIVRNDALEFIQHVGRDSFGCRVQHAMHHAVPHSVQRFEQRL